MHSAGMDRGEQPMPEGRNGNRLKGLIDRTRSVGNKRRSIRWAVGMVALSPRRKVMTAAVVLSIAGFLALVALPARESNAHPTNTGGNCSNCHPSTTLHFLSITGLPNTTYAPGTAYTIIIHVIDTNGATGENSFDFIVSSGTVSSSDPNVGVLAGNLEAHALVYTISTWTLTWTAPSSGSPQINTWAVWGGGQLSSSPYNHDTRTLSATAIPEFPTLVVPVLGAVGVVVVVARLTKKRAED